MSTPGAILTLTAAQHTEHLSERKALRRAAVASFMGNFVEWFDYAAYGYLATVIALTFFPQTDAATGLLATFAVFALSFIVRPIGGYGMPEWLRVTIGREGENTRFAEALERAL